MIMIFHFFFECVVFLCFMISESCYVFNLSSELFDENLYSDVTVVSPDVNFQILKYVT